MSLEEYGWTPSVAHQFEPYRRQGMEAGRVVLERRGQFRLYTMRGELDALPTGRMRHRAAGPEDLPAIGDWVAARPPPSGRGVARIHAVLPRKTKLSRKLPGSRLQEQVVAANVDQIFVVMGLDGDFNLRRAERFLTMIWESGARPVVVLNKADLNRRWEARRRQVESIAPGAPIEVTSCLSREGLEALTPYLKPGETTALVGSSGVGKSTLVNRLCGQDLMRTFAVRGADHRGRHTTSHRQLVLLPEGGLLIDNPGVREVQPWEAQRGLRETFEDIHALAADCQFRDCRHDTEPGCAVRQAVVKGMVAPQRLSHYRTIEEELESLALRQAELQRRGRHAGTHKPRRS